MRPILQCLSAFLLTGANSCTQGTSSDEAYDALMRIDNAQFVRGAPPDDNSGPAVEQIDLATKTIWPGYWNKLLKGALGPTATACSLRLVNDVGYWLLLSGSPDVATPTFPSFRATAEFNNDLPASAYDVEVRAVNAEGHFGVPSLQTLAVVPVMPSAPIPQGALVISLVWDTDADLDLHVTDPMGDEIYYGAPSTEDGFTPGAASDSSGVLTADSNAGCVIDGQRREDVVWAADPPAGNYLVRVDTPALCGQSIAHWKVNVYSNDELIANVSGTSLDSDTWGTRGRGAGLLAVSFQVP